MTKRQQWRVCLLCVLVAAIRVHAFAPPAPFVSSRRASIRTSTSRQVPISALKMAHNKSPSSRQQQQQTKNIWWKTAWKRLDTLESAGLKPKQPDSSSPAPLLMRGPGFKRVLFWFGVAFLYKWYRARFINKIPVWDRQPQWNMVITNREQEKELKAYTCKNCGTTLFIAKNREWFFEGDTGIGGLGCYTCGAKGKDNFVMDRDRILEDVGDDDDYFDYERPLDFVTAAERRAIMKKAKGDEDVANQMLIDASKEQAEQKQQQKEGETAEGAENVIDAEIESSTTTEEMEIEEKKEQTKDEESEVAEVSIGDEEPTEPPAVDDQKPEETEPEPEAKLSEPQEPEAKLSEPKEPEAKLSEPKEPEAKLSEPKEPEAKLSEPKEPEAKVSEPEEPVVKKKKKPKKSKKAKKKTHETKAPEPTKKKEPEPSIDDLDLDALGMDDF